jgi:hypothetical protein
MRGQVMEFSPRAKRVNVPDFLSKLAIHSWPSVPLCRAPKAPGFFNAPRCKKKSAHSPLGASSI